jgi:threonine/homoserine/homoserine lactone efflux protein
VSDILPPLPLLTAFLAASLLLAVTPGPGVFYIDTRSVTQGRLSGLASVAGVAAGNLGNAIGASLGLAALFAVLSVAFTVVKYVGALYLVWLGVQTLRSPVAGPDVPMPLTRGSLRRVLTDGFVVALLNPKTALFFLAFLPQFVPDPRVPVAQTLALGVLFVLIAAFTDTLYVVGAGVLRPVLDRASGLARAGRYVTAGAFIGLGILTAVSGQRTKH